MALMDPMDPMDIIAQHSKSYQAMTVTGVLRDLNVSGKLNQRFLPAVP
jgi:hypothetical protein